ncbi:MerR family transcriptional regulator [Heyndrickxia acidiproducens]|uniref:MerR family transcriptional regulator n=1 Tax=Heyndrickxia acidiproducens TaxID=1121084 RepID=UPI00037AE087|nr:MerR family transcriptional regulator [Heyndrickxia acidiproducens]
MNTSHVAKELGVSQSTIKRWIKQLGLEIQLNELGHFHFCEEDIAVLKQIQKKIQNGVLLSDIRIKQKDGRRGKIVLVKKETAQDELLDKMKMLERKIEKKADDVVSYQLMTHRKELDDLETEINRLNQKIAFLEKQIQIMNNQFETAYAVKMRQESRTKKKGIFTMLFGI